MQQKIFFHAIIYQVRPLATNHYLHDNDTIHFCCFVVISLTVISLFLLFSFLFKFFAFAIFFIKKMLEDFFVVIVEVFNYFSVIIMKAFNEIFSFLWKVSDGLVFMIKVIDCHLYVNMKVFYEISLVIKIFDGLLSFLMKLFVYFASEVIRSYFNPSLRQFVFYKKDIYCSDFTQWFQYITYK